MKFAQLREKTYHANQLLYDHKLSILTWGNASQMDHNQGVFGIKPSGVPYKNLKPKDIVIMDLEGNIVDGSCRPSTDTPTHLELYRAYPSIGGIVHAHSKFATVFAQAGKEIPCYGTTHADTFHGSIPLTRKLSHKEICGEYEKATAGVIIERLTQLHLSPEEMPAILVHSHAPFVWGKSASEAVEHALILETVAEMSLFSEQINHCVQSIESHLLEKHYQRKHGKKAYYGQLAYH